MDSLEPDAQSFIVKVWVEDSIEKAGRGVWHGHITDVPSHERRYLKNLSEIEAALQRVTDAPKARNVHVFITR
jgi:hypothetical protein